MIDFITWKADPAIFHIGGWEFRWYALAFVIGLTLGYQVVLRIWRHEKLNQEWLDSLFFYVFFGMLIGARLGHILFYDPISYLQHPLEIFAVWHGGLASHGGTIGIIIAIWIYSRRVTHKSMLWTFDRLVVPVGFVAALIRLGNLMNHEIYGHAANVPWAFRFIENLPYVAHGYAPVFSAPSHPTQLYEAACYILTGLICLWMYWKREDYKYPGLIFGVFLIGIFLSRFFVEYFKNVQEDFEIQMIHTIGLNMGQLLSVPFILAGLWLVIRGLSIRRKSKDLRI